MAPRHVCTQVLDSQMWGAGPCPAKRCPGPFSILFNARWRLASLEPCSALPPRSNIRKAGSASQHSWPAHRDSGSREMNSTRVESATEHSPQPHPLNLVRKMSPRADPQSTLDELD